MFFDWPYTDLHSLNLDWILSLCKQIKTILDDPSAYFEKYIEENVEKFLPTAMYIEETKTIRLKAGEIEPEETDHIYNTTKETMYIKDGVVSSKIILKGR